MIIIFALALFFVFALAQVSNTSYGTIIGIDEGNVSLSDGESMQSGMDWLNTNGNGTIYLNDHNYRGKYKNSYMGLYKNHSMSIDIDNKNITVIGKHEEGTIISGGYTDYIFKVGPEGHLTLINITILNPSIFNVPIVDYWRSFRVSPIYNFVGTVDLINCTIIGCRANRGAGVIHNYRGVINIFNSTFNDNVARYGGVIFNNEGNVTINSSNFNNNKATDYGGTIYNYYGIVQINNSNITNGVAPDGGAIYNDRVI